MIFDDMVDAQLGYHHGFGRHYFLLYSVVIELEASNVFEFGIGLSTRVMLDALSKTGGRLVSCANMDPVVARITEDEMCSDRWTHLFGKSQDILSEKVLNKNKVQALDLVLHDGAHTASVVQSDLGLVIPRMRQNGLILVHDTEYTYGGMLDSVMGALSDVDFECVTLPYGCGLTIVRVCSDQGNGKVKLEWKKQK